MSELGKLLIVIGGMMIAAGVILILVGKSPLGRLPGDLMIRRDNVTFFFPVVSSLIISIILSVILWLIFRARP